MKKLFFLLTLSICTLNSQIVISEIMQNPSAVTDANGEWFEVHNSTGSIIDINGWTIQDFSSSSTHTINNGGPLNVPAGGFLVLGRNSTFAQNGGVIISYQYSSVLLGNTADGLILFDIILTEIDRVIWDGGPLFPDPTGASMYFNGTASDDNNIGSNWGTSTITWTGSAGDFGSPGTQGESPLPVELSSFTAEPVSDGVLLKWTTESEIENLGFLLERKTAGTSWQEIVSYKNDDALMGHGTVSFATDYEYTDKFVQQGNTYEYRLADVDYNGVVTYHATREVFVESNPLATIADNFTVMAYPNPFNPSTTIRYSIPTVQTHSNASVLIAIYDITGKLVTTLVNKEQVSGWYEIQWSGTNQNGKEVPGGVYLSRVTVGNAVKTNKLILLR